MYLVFKKEVFEFSGAVVPPCWAGNRRAGVHVLRRRRGGEVADLLSLTYV